MAKTRSKWLLGCGIGCGAVILLGVLLITGGFFLLRNTVKGFDAAIDAREELAARFGQPATFTPSADGSIPAERMEVFLAVRDSLSCLREEITSTFVVFENADAEMEQETSALRKITKGLSLGRKGMGLGGQLGDYLHTRNRALLNVGMGLGEYSFIFVMSYYVFLGESPSDGPSETNVTIEIDGETVVRQGSGEPRWDSHRTSRRIQRDLMAMLANQLAAIPDTGADPATSRWRSELSAEIAALEVDPNRLVWRDGAPQALEVSLEPYREALTASYSSTANAFELATPQKKGIGVVSD